MTNWSYNPVASLWSQSIDFCVATCLLTSRWTIRSLVDILNVVVLAMLGIVVSSRVLIRRPKPRLKSTLLTRLRKMIFPGRSRWSTRSGSKERVGAGSIPSDLQILLFLLFSWLVFGALLFKIIVAIMPLWQNSATYFKANAAQSDGFNGDSTIVFVLISDTFAICKLLIFFWNKVKKGSL